MRYLALLAISCICCESASGAALHVDTFDTGVQGWSGGGVPTRIATGGAGDGGAYVNVSAASALATFNTSPEWTGDLAAIGADRIRVDMMAPTTSAPLAMRLVLFGPFTTQERWTSTAPLTVPNDGVWRKFTFSLLAGDMVATIPSVPPIPYSAVLSNTLRVMFRHDPGAPSHGGEFVNGELNLDNVELATAPNPADFDADGDVDGDDLNHPTLGWRQRFGTDLEGEDFLQWQRNLAAPPVSLATSAVPEPLGLAYLLAGIVLVPGGLRSARRLRDEAMRPNVI